MQRLCFLSGQLSSNFLLFTLSRFAEICAEIAIEHSDMRKLCGRKNSAQLETLVVRE